MPKIQKVCLGTCHAEITEEQYANGLTICGAEACTMKGKPFVDGYKCEKCGMTYKENEKHSC